MCVVALNISIGGETQARGQVNGTTDPCCWSYMIMCWKRLKYDQEFWHQGAHGACSFPMALVIDTMGISRSRSTGYGAMARQTKHNLLKVRQKNCRIYCREHLTFITWFDERRNLLDAYSPLLSAALCGIYHQTHRYCMEGWRDAAFALRRGYGEHEGASKRSWLGEKCWDARSAEKKLVS